MPLACVHARHACCTLRGRSLSTLAVFREACRGLTKVHRGASVVARVRFYANTGRGEKKKQKNKTFLPIKSRRQRQGPSCIQPPRLLSGPSRHISVMAPHRSRGTLVCTQCPLIGRNAKESRWTVSRPVARRLACAVPEIALFFCLICGESSPHLHASASCVLPRHDGELPSLFYVSRSCGRKPSTPKLSRCRTVKRRPRSR